MIFRGTLVLMVASIFVISQVRTQEEGTTEETSAAGNVEQGAKSSSITSGVTDVVNNLSATGTSVYKGAKDLGATGFHGVTSVGAAAIGTTARMGRGGLDFLTGLVNTGLGYTKTGVNFGLNSADKGIQSVGKYASGGLGSLDNTLTTLSKSSAKRLSPAASSPAAAPAS